MYSGRKAKLRQVKSQDSLTKPTVRMAAASSYRSSQPASQKHYESPSSAQRSEPDFTSGMTPLIPQNSTIGPDLLAQFERVLHKALQNTSDAITDKLTREIREVGRRTSILEQRMDEFDITTSVHTEELESLKEDYTNLQTRLEDFENRARRSNLRIRGIPEDIEDLQSTVTALFQELAPSIPIERLEMDRIHRALTSRNADGPPRDVILKMHYFRTKEQLMEAARNKDSLIFQGHRYQIFQDLSQITLLKRKEMKPHLQVLQYHRISYRWGFPFSLRFSYKGTLYTCKSTEDLLNVIKDLRLSTPTATTDGPKRRLSSFPPPQLQDLQDPQATQAPLSPHKRGRFTSSPPAEEDITDS